MLPRDPRYYSGHLPRELQDMVDEYYLDTSVQLSCYFAGYMREFRFRLEVSDPKFYCMWTYDVSSANKLLADFVKDTAERSLDLTATRRMVYSFGEFSIYHYESRRGITSVLQFDKKTSQVIWRKFQCIAANVLTKCQDYYRSNPNYCIIPNYFH